MGMLPLAGKTVLVVGMGRSGHAAARLARALDARVICNDLDPDARGIQGCEQVFGAHPVALFAQADVVVLSPGIPPTKLATQLDSAQANGADVVGELQLAAAVIDQSTETGQPRLPMLAVSGTNGKSSVCAYTGQLLVQAGLRPFVGGNLGRPLSLLAVGRNPDPTPGDRLGEHDVAVVEVSSYQSEAPGQFRPQVVALLNLSPDHLARHGDMARYAQAKLRLLKHLGPGDTVILPVDAGPFEAGAQAAFDRGAALLRVGGWPGATVHPDRLVLYGTDDDGPVDLSEVALLGDHNRVNVAFAVLLAVSAGADRRRLQPAALVPLPHRLEILPSADGRRWINDSKATNLDSARTGIAAVSGPKVVLLGGAGKDGARYAELLPVLGPGDEVICFGHSGPEIAAALAPVRPKLEAGFAEAVARARTQAMSGGTVLLSPACASFDEFSSFEARGEALRALVSPPHRDGP